LFDCFAVTKFLVSRTSLPGFNGEVYTLLPFTAYETDKVTVFEIFPVFIRLTVAIIVGAYRQTEQDFSVWGHFGYDISVTAFLSINT